MTWARMTGGLAALFVAVCGAPAGSQTMNEPAPEAVADTQAAQSAWARVQAASSPEEQANAVGVFLRALPSSGGRPAALSMTAKDIASGRTVGFEDPSLMQRPQSHEVTVFVGTRSYVFTPLSRASLTPLLRE